MDEIKLYLRDLIDFYNTKGEWKVQLSMSITFISYINTDQIQLMHWKSDNVKTKRGVDANDTIQELISTFLQRYQEGLETKLKGSDYIFNHVNLLEYHVHKVSLNQGSSYIPQPEWVSQKKSTLNPYNHSDNRCFLYAIVIALNYHNIDNNPQIISNLLPFIASYNWLNIDFPAGHKDYSTFEKDNMDIALNILFAPHNMQEIRQCYISKHNKTRNTHAMMINDYRWIW